MAFCSEEKRESAFALPPEPKGEKGERERDGGIGADFSPRGSLRLTTHTREGGEKGKGGGNK